MAEEIETDKAEQISLIVFQIVGSTPLLMHNIEGMGKPRTERPVDEKSTRPDPESDWARGESEPSVYRLPDKQLYMPTAAFLKGLIVKGTKGKKFGKFTGRDVIGAAVTPMESECRLYDSNTGKKITKYEVHVAPVRIGSSRIWRCRPMVRSWACDLPVMLDEHWLNRNNLQEMWNVAGVVAGAGDWRPEKMGSHGKYQVSIRKN
ncbi:MAG TPA: hypothetical protein VM182_02430 [Terriglobia bacterium]|nr:hypothetical protein [Terriglobia bacterium]